MSIADDERRLEHFTRFVKHEKNGVSCEMVIFHVACRVPLHAEPIVFTVKVTSIAGDDQILLSEFNILIRLCKTFSLVENKGFGFNRYGIDFSIFQFRRGGRR